MDASDLEILLSLQDGKDERVTTLDSDAPILSLSFLMETLGDSIDQNIELKEQINTL